MACIIPTVKKNRPIWEEMLEDENACFGAFIILVLTVLAALVF